jgi:hypothetical protein
MWNCIDLWICTNVLGEPAAFIFHSGYGHWIPLKYWCLFTKLHCVTSQKTLCCDVITQIPVRSCSGESHTYIVTVLFICPTVVTGEHTHQSCINPSQGIYRGTNWKVSLFIYLQIIYYSIKYKHLLLRCDTSTWHLCQQQIAFPTVLSSRMLIPHLCQRHINNHMHSTCMLIYCQPIAFADSSTYQLSRRLTLLRPDQISSKNHNCKH